MRKKRSNIAKLGFTFVILLLALASIGYSYAAWYDTITITGTVTTGEWWCEETAWARMNEYDLTYEFPGSSWATYIKCIPADEENIQTFYLYAGQHYRVGELMVWKNTTHLFVEYDLDDGYNMSESHLHVNTSLEGIPQTPSGDPNPKIGNFDYGVSHVGSHVTEYTYEILWDSAWDGLDLYIAAHAVVWGGFGCLPCNFDC